jgi:hypothetical protein
MVGGKGVHSRHTRRASLREAQSDGRRLAAVGGAEFTQPESARARCKGSVLSARADWYPRLTVSPPPAARRPPPAARQSQGGCVGKERRVGATRPAGCGR